MLSDYFHCSLRISSRFRSCKVSPEKSGIFGNHPAPDPNVLRSILACWFPVTTAVSLKTPSLLTDKSSQYKANEKFHRLHCSTGKRLLAPNTLGVRCLDSVYAWSRPAALLKRWALEKRVCQPASTAFSRQVNFEEYVREIWIQNVKSWKKNNIF